MLRDYRLHLAVEFCLLAVIAGGAWGIVQLRHSPPQAPSAAPALAPAQTPPSAPADEELVQVRITEKGPPPRCDLLESLTRGGSLSDITGHAGPRGAHTTIVRERVERVLLAHINVESPSKRPISDLAEIISAIKAGLPKGQKCIIEFLITPVP